MNPPALARLQNRQPRRSEAEPLWCHAREGGALACHATTTAGILINIETVSGYLYVYLARQQ